jgi:predicted membrane protein
MKTNDTKSLGIGIIIITLGFIALAANLGYITKDVYRYIFSWYGWTLYVGPILMLKSNSRVLGTIFLACGLTFLLGDMGIIPNLNVGQFWPLIVVAVGANFIYKAMNSNIPDAADIDASGSFVNDNHIFGGGDFSIQSQNFKGGKILALFGGGNYILNQAKLSEETDCVIDVTCIFGGVNLIVPADWNVQVTVSAIFGGYNDKRKLIKSDQVDSSKTLYVKGLALFGGGEVKSY